MKSAWIAEEKFQNGLVTLHLKHTSASLLIRENADPDVRTDLESFFKRLVPDGDRFSSTLRKAMMICRRTSARR